MNNSRMLNIIKMKKLIKFSVVFFLAAGIFSSCNKDHVAPEISTFVINSDTTIRVGSSLSLEANITSELVYHYNWYINNELKSNEPVYVFTPEKTGEYAVKLLVKNKYGSDSIDAVVTVKPRLITIDFGDLSLGSNSFWNGSNGAGSFTSGIANFRNYYYSDYSYWEGFSYSNRNDAVTSGYANQYSVFNKENNGNTFALFYPPYAGVASVSFSNGQSVVVESIKVCNDSYPALSMTNGDAMAKKFGGSTGNDPDFYKLIIAGLDKNGQMTKTVEFYLADFRFSDNSQDYIVDTWTSVDISSLGAVNQLTFKFESSDNGTFGMNTPAYVCIDDIVYNEPED